MGTIASPPRPRIHSTVAANGRPTGGSLSTPSASRWPATTLLAVGTVAFAIHPAMDVLCGGVECRPREAISQRAVYDHVRGRWLRPRRLVRYAGAPEDLLAAAVAGLPALAVATGHRETGLVAVLVGSAAFVAVRRRLAGVSERLFADRA